MTVRYLQSLLDIALQMLGAAEGAIQLAIDNGKSLTSDLEPGETLTAPAQTQDSRMVQYYTVGGYSPATAIDASSGTPTAPGGINYMGIEIDFKVS